MERFLLIELLRWAESPGPVLRWARDERALQVSLEEVEDAMGLLERTPSAEHAVWLAAVLTLPLELVAMAGALVVEADGLALASPLVQRACAAAIDAIAGSDDPAALLGIAAQCEARRGPAESSYRGDDPRVERTLSAAGALCRSVEALAAARVRIAFERDAAASARNAILGAATLAGGSAKAILHDREQPLVLARPAFGEAAVPHDLRAAVGLLADALAVLEAADRHRVRNAFLDALASE